MIDALDKVVQKRFADPAPLALGMSRQAVPISVGQHFNPILTRTRDFELYLLGQVITKSEPEELNYRALKGPAAMTSGTVRPAWYPSFTTLAFSPQFGGFAHSTPQVASPPARLVQRDRALPDWREIYPLARKAMRSFPDGGTGFETEFSGWNVVARPVVASFDRCVTCHNHMTPGDNG